MSLLAIAHVVNDGVVERQKGWKEGLRIIDTLTEETRDLPYNIIEEGIKEGIQIANVKLGEQGINIIFNKNPGGYPLEFPIVKVAAGGKQSLVGKDRRSRENSLFILRCSPPDVVGPFNNIVCRVCSGLGTEVKQVLRNRVDFTLVLNYDRREDEITGAECTALSETGIFHKEAREYVTRASMLGMMHAIMVDGLDSGAMVLGIAPGAGRELEIPDYVTEIYKSALWHQKDIDRIIVSGSVKDIESFTFNRVVTKEIILKEGVASIEDEAFTNCSVDRVVIPKNTKIEMGAFKLLKCKELVLMTQFVHEGQRGGHEIVEYTLRTTDVDKIILHERTLRSLLRYYLEVRYTWRTIKFELAWSRHIIEVVDNVIYESNHTENVDRLWKLPKEQLRELLVAILNAFYRRDSHMTYNKKIGLLE